MWLQPGAGAGEVCWSPDSLRGVSGFPRKKVVGRSNQEFCLPHFYHQGLFGAVFCVMWKLQVLADSEILAK